MAGRMRSADRRRQLLEVAADLFARRGFHGATTAELARAAGITEPILYRHFKNKLHLFITLVDEVSSEVILGWESVLEGVDDPYERLDTLLAHNPATHERGENVYRVIFQAMTDSDVDRGIRRALRRHLTTIHEFVKNELASLQKAGAVRNDEPATALAWLLVNVAVGYGMTSPLGAGGAGSRRKRVMERILTDLVSA